MKHLIETVGPHMLMDPYTGEQIAYNRPSVVTYTPFTATRIAAGVIKLLAADISDEASDDFFLEYWNDSDGKQDLAVAAFMSKFGSEGTPLESLDDALVIALTEALNALTEGDFQKDGKPKVGPLDTLVEGTKITTAIRDQFWDAFTKKG